MVDNRCAITKQVFPAISLRMADWIWISVRVSTLLVASSRISICAFKSMALAMVISCFCPWEILICSKSVSAKLNELFCVF